VSLAGEIRPVAHAALRQREAAKLGFTQACGPPDCRVPDSSGDSSGKESSIRYKALTQLPNLVDRILAEV
jgi:DNA repair protein RadA/Sms